MQFRHPFPRIGDAAYRQHAGGGPSHGHRQHAQKFGNDRVCGSGDMVADRDIDTQADILITILRYRFSGQIITDVCQIADLPH